MSDQVEPTVAPAPSIEDRLAAVLGAEQPTRDTTGRFAPKQPQTEPPATAEAAVEPEVPDQAAESEEVTADDLPDDHEPQQSSALDSFEIEWNGETKVIGRDEIRELAQKGYDYTAKTQAIAEERTRVQMMAQALQQQAAVQQAIVDDVANAKAIQRELAKFPQTPEQWMKASQEDPLAAFQARTQYDALIQQHQQTLQQIQHKSSQLQRGQAQITAEQLRSEFAKAQEKVPAWKNQDAFKKDAESIRSYLTKAEGYSDDEVNGLTDHRALTVAYKAWRYDQLVKAKGERLKQVRSAPPVIKPGSAQASNINAQSKLAEAKARLKKSGDVNDAAALILRMTK